MAYRYDILHLQCLTMAFDQLGHQCNTPLRRNISEADQSRMRDIVQKDELPEIGVDGRQNPVFDIRTFEQRPIARVGTKLASFENIYPVDSRLVRSRCTKD